MDHPTARSLIPWAVFLARFNAVELAALWAVALIAPDILGFLLTSAGGIVDLTAKATIAAVQSMAQRNVFSGGTGASVLATT
jgi:hypothetical protein